MSTELAAIRPPVEVRPAAAFRRLPLAIAAGLLLAGGFPPLGWPLLLPAGIALLVLTLEAPALTIRKCAYLGLASGAVFFGISLSWLFNLFGASAIALVFIASSFLMLFSGLYVFARRRFPGLPAWLVAATIWTGIEFFRSEPFWLSFGWMGLGYGPVAHPFAAMLASVAGCYAVSFLVAAIGTALVVGPGGSGPPARRAALLAGGWLALFLIPGPALQVERPLRVRLVQALSAEPEEALRLSDTPGAPAVDVIVWPEYIAMEDPTKGRLWASIGEMVRRRQAWLVLGGKEYIGPPEEDRYRNTAFIVNPSGQLAGKHYKNHTVHLLKDGIPSRGAEPIRTGVGNLGVAICFDMDYPDVARRLVDRGAEVLLVPNMDPGEWGPLQREQHRLMFQMRAAECGRWVARADVEGGTSVAAPNGRQTGDIRTTESGFLDVVVDRRSQKTPFVMGGWVFGPACFLVAAGGLLYGRLRQARPPVAGE